MAFKRSAEAALWPPDPDWFNARSANWLRRAEDVRLIAETMRSLEMRLVLERIATSYEQLAELVAKQKDLALMRRRRGSAASVSDSKGNSSTA